MELWHRNTLGVFKDPYWQIRDQGQPGWPPCGSWGCKTTRCCPAISISSWIRWTACPGPGATPSRRANYLRTRAIPCATARRNRTPRSCISSMAASENAAGKTGTTRSAKIAGREGFPAGPGRKRREGQSHARQRQNPRRPDRPLSADNRIVHGLWIGPTLSKMELLTIRSFLRHGHEFHLWVYDKIQTPLPKEVVLEDANKIIPRNRIIKKRTPTRRPASAKAALVRRSPIFRYKLLYKKGGYWVDMDVTCLRRSISRNRMSSGRIASAWWETS